MVVVDVPVNAGEQALRLFRQCRRRRTAAHVDAIGVEHEGVQGREESWGQAVICVRSFKVHRAGVFEFRVVDQEEQLVLDDRAAQRGAVFFLFENAGIERAGAAEGRFAYEVLVAVVVISSAVELVGAALGDDVDAAAGEVGRGHGVVSSHKLDRLDDIEIDRRAARSGKAAAEAEVIFLDSAVDRDAVEARVDAGDRKVVRAAGDRQRVAGKNRGEIAVQCRLVCDVTRGEVRTNTAVKVKHVDSSACNDDFLKNCGVIDGRKCQAERRLRAGSEAQAFERAAFIPGCRNGDAVWAAGAQTSLEEVAVRAGGQRAGGAGRLMDDRDRRARNSCALVVQNCAADFRSGFLCINGRYRRKCRNGGDGCAARKEVLDHGVFPEVADPAGAPSCRPGSCPALAPLHDRLVTDN